MLFLNVSPDDVLGHRAVGRNKVSVSPETVTPICFFQLGEFFPDFPGGSALDQIHDFTGGKAGFGGKEEVDMVRIDGKLRDFKLVDFRAQPDHRGYSGLDLALKHSFTVFRDPDKVILDVISGVSGVFQHNPILPRARNTYLAGAAFISSLERLEYSAALIKVAHLAKK